MPEISETLQSAINLAHRGLAELDPEGLFAAVDPGFLSMLGKAETELLGRHWHCWIHQDDRDRVQEAYDLARSSGHAYVEIRGLRKDGSGLCQALTVSGLHGIGGALTGHHCRCRDISGCTSDQEAPRLRAKDVGDSAAKVAALAQAGIRVLLVEDNAEHVVPMRAYLETLSLSLDFASNGPEALKALRLNSYDLVLMDIQMPVMDGYAATRAIRAWEKAHSAPRVAIVALTADALTPASAESLEAGCDGQLAKPVRRHELMATIVKFATRSADPDVAIPESILALQPVYLANRSRDLMKMQDALGAGDFAAVQVIGHNCKGTGAGYGFPEIGRLGAALEIAARACSADEVGRSIRLLERCVSALQQEDLEAGSRGNESR